MNKTVNKASVKSVSTEINIDEKNAHLYDDIPLADIQLPNQWVLYLYDKSLFKKITNRQNFRAKPHKELCTISTVNDLIYILQLMQVSTGTDSNCNLDCKMEFADNDKINLDMNDYIIMRKGIEPVWEDPKNSNGGTFTIKMSHTKGYDTWSTFIMYMLGETMTYDMTNINGITVSYISDAHSFGNVNSNNNNYTYIKIWDAKANRTRENFVKILPLDLYDKIKNESLLYTPNSNKKHYGQENIMEKINSKKKSEYKSQGGFTSYRKK